MPTDPNIKLITCTLLKESYKYKENNSMYKYLDFHLKNDIRKNKIISNSNTAINVKLTNRK